MLEPTTITTSRLTLDLTILIPHSIKDMMISTTMFHFVSSMASKSTNVPFLAIKSRCNSSKVLLMDRNLQLGLVSSTLKIKLMKDLLYLTSTIPPSPYQSTSTTKMPTLNI